jgi:hypothetical protein
VSDRVELSFQAYEARVLPIDELTYCT